MGRRSCIFGLRSGVLIHKMPVLFPETRLFFSKARVLFHEILALIHEMPVLFPKTRVFFSKARVLFHKVRVLFSMGPRRRFSGPERRSIGGDRHFKTRDPQSKEDNRRVAAPLRKIELLYI